MFVRVWYCVGLEMDRFVVLVGRYKLFFVMGVIEWVGGILYCMVVFFDFGGEYFGKYCKLMLIVFECFIWGFGDGFMFLVFDMFVGKLGVVICWENCMFFLWIVMYGKGMMI